MRCRRAVILWCAVLAACSGAPDTQPLPSDSPVVTATTDRASVTIPSSPTGPTPTTEPAPVPARVDLPAVPDGPVVHVAPDGDDAADGSSQRPLRTVERAMDVLSSSGGPADGAGVVRLAAGTYHEPLRLRAGVAVVGDPDDPSRVVIDGAVATSGWRDDRGTWSIEWSRSTAIADHDAIPADRPEAAANEIVVIDGRVSRQLVDGSRPGPGEFAVVDGRLVIGDDPSGRRVEASQPVVGVDMQGADGARLSGVTVRRWATPLDRLAAVRAYGDGIVVDHVVVEDNASMGLSVIGEGVLVSDVVVRSNGYIGLHAHDSMGLTVQSATVTANNAEGFDPVHSGAGVKVTSTDGLTLVDVVSTDNDGPGVWTDLAVHDATIARCVVTGNVGSGVLIELSGSVRVVDCTVSATRDSDRRGVDVQGAGVWVLESNDVVVEDSTVSDNAPEVWVQDGPRTPDPSFATDPSVLWDLRDVTLRGLTIGPGRSGDPALVLVDDWTATRPAADMHVAIVDTSWRTGDVAALMRWARWPDDPLIVDDPDKVSALAVG